MSTPRPEICYFCGSKYEQIERAEARISELEGDWNSALEEAAKLAVEDDHLGLADAIRALKRELAEIRSKP